MLRSVSRTLSEIGSNPHEREVADAGIEITYLAALQVERSRVFRPNDGSVSLGKKDNRHRRFDSDVY